jgi:hypothetical protein
MSYNIFSNCLSSLGSTISNTPHLNQSHQIVRSPEYNTDSISIHTTSSPATVCHHQIILSQTHLI